MAETYTTEYTNAFISSPRGNNQGYQLLPLFFNYTHAANGTAGDTILIRKLPPHALLDMYGSWISFSGWTSGATFSLGWQAYKDEDGTTQSASATGLLN